MKSAVHVIRPIRLSDLDALLKLAQGAGVGFTSLPPVAEFLQAKIELSERSFAEAVAKPGHERYMFVLEDAGSGKVGGCCAVEAACGLDEPFYNYRIGTTVHASRELKIYKLTPTCCARCTCRRTSAPAATATCCRAAASC
jgi:arginine N-succinyltransferase